MKAVIQRVNEASVIINGEIYSKINKGILVFIGVEKDDKIQQAEFTANKICDLRIFEDENSKMNLSINDIDGELLIVSQFTLTADCKKGRRPSFDNSATPDEANSIYEYFVSLCKKRVNTVNTGVFGADMKISLINDGPVTFIISK